MGVTTCYVADLANNTTRAIREYLDSISRAQWDEDRVLQMESFTGCFLLGEIASALPESLRDRYPDVAWRHIWALQGDLAVHRYFVVDWAVRCGRSPRRKCQSWKNR